MTLDELIAALQKIRETAPGDTPVVDKDYDAIDDVSAERLFGFKDPYVVVTFDKDEEEDDDDDDF